MNRNDGNRYIIYRKNGAGIGAPVFPSPTAGNGKVDGAVADGFYRCKQCGMGNILSSTVSSGGSDDGNGGVTVGTDNDPTVRSGCVLCGTNNSR